MLKLLVWGHNLGTSPRDSYGPPLGIRKISLALRDFEKKLFGLPEVV